MGRGMVGSNRSSYLVDVLKEGKPTCSICSKSFGSLKSLFGHMRCHPERTWRGMQQPPDSGHCLSWSSKDKRGRTKTTSLSLPKPSTTVTNDDDDDDEMLYSAVDGLMMLQAGSTATTTTTSTITVPQSFDFDLNEFPPI